MRIIIWAPEGGKGFMQEERSQRSREKNERAHSAHARARKGRGAGGGAIEQCAVRRTTRGWTVKRERGRERERERKVGRRQRG